jgi:hypothetical protein
MRDFTGGMHCNPTRECIEEQSLWWLENLQPLASGNLVWPPAAGALSSTSETTLPYYTNDVQIGATGTTSVTFSFAAFTNGNAWIINSVTGTATQIMTGQLSGSIGKTAVTTYIGVSNTGFLIIDPNGYWDYGVTTPSTLTSLSGGVSGGTNVDKNSVAGGTALHQVNVVSGTGGSWQTIYQVISATINAAGTGYVVGDVLSLTDNSPIAPAQIVVTAIGGGGTVTGISLSTGGQYPGPVSGAGFNTGPSGNTVSGGSGTGATFHDTIQALSFQVNQPGHGYTAGNVTADETAGLTVISEWSLTAGPVNGQSIATYAGRVWIGTNNVLNYTNVASYSMFGGAGGSITISDAYLLLGITALFSANNYLYIFGASSVDVLSNVTVSATTGLTSFSRVNVLQGIGTVYNMTIVGYGRSVGFLDYTGYYLLAGATPDRISDRVQNVFRNPDWPALGPPWPSAGVFTINGELCLGVMMQILDNFQGFAPTSAGGQARFVIMVYQRHRWWVYKPYISNASGGYLAGAIQGPMSGNTLQQSNNFTGVWYIDSGGHAAFGVLFSTAPGMPWILRTKLWDGAAAMREKQGINVALGAIWQYHTNTLTTNVTFTVDSELQVSTAQAMPGFNQFTAGAYNYDLDVLYGVMAPNQAGGGPGVQGQGSQYIGLTFNGAALLGGATGAYLTTLSLVAMRGKQERNMLE